jgi:hypothetical protein
MLLNTLSFSIHEMKHETKKESTRNMYQSEHTWAHSATELVDGNGNLEITIALHYTRLIPQLWYFTQHETDYPRTYLLLS